MDTYSTRSSWRSSIVRGGRIWIWTLVLTDFLAFWASISLSENSHYNTKFMCCCKDEIRQIYKPLAQCLANISYPSSQSYFPYCLIAYREKYFSTSFLLEGKGPSTPGEFFVLCNFAKYVGQIERAVLMLPCQNSLSEISSSICSSQSSCRREWLLQRLCICLNPNLDGHFFPPTKLKQRSS